MSSLKKDHCKNVALKLNLSYRVARNFCGLAISCVLRELIFAITRDWFFLLGINCCGFQGSTQYPALIIFSFLLSTCNRNTYFQTIKQYFVVYRFVSEWKRQVVIEQTRFLGIVFLCSEFKLENIYCGENFSRKNVCGNFYLRERIFADRWKICEN